MYSKELEEIIEAALADGEITEKERAVLHKRAIAEGVDPDELDIIIEGRLAKMKKIEKDWLRPTPPQIHEEKKQNSKYGIVNKCPQCGAVIEAGSVKCAECGYMFRGIEANSSIEKFSEKLNEIENRFAGKNSLFQNTVFEQFSLGTDDRTKAIQTAIEAFPIPTTKEDLLEFSIFLKSKGKRPYPSSPSQDKICSSYRKKFNECIDKAKIYFTDDPQFKAIIPQKKGLFGGLFGKK